VSFSHLPKNPRGGPDGGDGGKGGDVYLQASEEYHSFEHLQKDALFKAEDGSPGGKNKRHGKNGNNLTVFVPPGTAVYEKQRKGICADLVSDGDKVRVTEGGRGGKGNINFATSTSQAPRIATPGREGRTKVLNLLFSPNADIVVIGAPNSGKSSLIACMTGASPEIASYPFTTRKPHLWTYMHDFSRYVFLDTAPLVPETLEEIKILSRRAKILLFILDGTQIKDWAEVEKPMKEIENHFEKDPKKIAKVITKIDQVKDLPEISTPHPVFSVSSTKKEGFEELKKFLFGD
jgi:GTP-binding protein